MNKINNENKRWFFFAYSYPTGMGNLATYTNDGTFPKMSDLKMIMATRSNHRNDEIVILSWCEFKQESDFADFYS